MRNAPFFLTALLLGAVSPASAAPPLQTTKPVGLSGISQPGDAPAQAYRHALYNLRAGGPYNRAIIQLQFCTAHDPKNRSDHLALGCAYADRAASVGYSAMWTAALAEERSRYAPALQDWQKAQSDPKADGYGDPRPVPPPDIVFPTKDDWQPYTLSAAQATAQIKRLSLSAQAQWQQAVTLSTTPAERADAEWVQGCGLRLLHLTASGAESDADAAIKPSEGGTGLPAQKDVVDALSAATRDAPRNAVYWQSLGDELRPSESDKDPAPAMAAYNKALALQPINTGLWFRLYQSALSVQSAFRKPEEAERALQHVIGSDPDNAYPRYLLATLLFQRTHFGDPNNLAEPADREKSLLADYDAMQYKDADAALTQIELANSAPRYAEPDYVSPAPELLTGFDIWKSVTRMVNASFAEMSRLRELARAAGGYGQICAARGDRAGLEQGARDAIGVGQRMLGDWPLRDSPGGNEVITALVGFAVVAVGYRNLVKGYTQMGDTPAAQAAQGEWDGFKARLAAWRKAHDAATEADTIYGAY